MDKMNLDAWAGRETTDRGGISVHQAAQIHATLGAGPAPAHGEALPQLWHWCAFPIDADNSLLGEDGHVRSGALLPPVHLPRRMWAGGALIFHKALHVGEEITRRSRVRSVVEKETQTGPMVLVTVDHDIHGADGLAIQERQDIVYLNIPDTFTPPKKRPIEAEAVEQIDTPPTLLFRYSALTFNAHRIHYDLPYTQQVERYPGLVVHGPMQATWLMRAATRAKGRPPMFFDFRGVHPMFAGTACDIAMADDTSEGDGGLRLWTGQDGHQCMQARAVWEETQ